MDKRNAKVTQKRRLAVFTLAAGSIFCAAGVALERGLAEAPFNARIITGFGIFLLGLGIAAFTSYMAVRGSSLEAARILNEELDERLGQIRLKAGNSAYWVSLVMAYIALMWVSLASNGSLPALDEDAIWWLLTALVVVPFGVYAAVMMIAQKG